MCAAPNRRLMGAWQDPFGNRFGLIENPLFDLKAVR